MAMTANVDAFTPYHHHDDNRSDSELLLFLLFSSPAAATAPPYHIDTAHECNEYPGSMVSMMMITVLVLAMLAMMPLGAIILLTHSLELLTKQIAGQQFPGQRFAHVTGKAHLFIRV